MAELKTKKTVASVEAFLDKLDPARREDCRALAAMMKMVSGEEAKMWGSSIVGFGTYHYVYESGREGDTCVIGFSPRKSELALYVGLGSDGRYSAELAKLGKHKTGKGCLYLKRLADVDLKILQQILDKSVAAKRKKLKS